VKLRPVATQAGFDLGHYSQKSGNMLRPHAECAPSPLRSCKSTAVKSQRIRRRQYRWTRCSV